MTHDEILNLKAQLQELKDQAEEIESQERERAKTSLALKLEVVTCEFVTLINRADRTIPEQRFGQIKCPFGKSEPDQDCRDCGHVRYVTYGSHLAPHEKRYVNHGMVVPIPNEEASDTIAGMLKQMNIKPLRRVQHEIVAMERLIEIAERQEAEQALYDIEKQQRGEL